MLPLIVARPHTATLYQSRLIYHRPDRYHLPAFDPRTQHDSQITLLNHRQHDTTHLSVPGFDARPIVKQ